ncbi:SCO6880 family protein [Paenarthrobacter sp. NPDC057355]|uniref:SCO6880 family protein n=1 Tax=Paenarthrobacter sp. NPDC057355 TaxID=3346105 RepID=UPI00362E7756
MSEPTIYTEPTYGNWRKPRTGGIGKLGSLETGLLIGGLLVVIILFRFTGALGGAAALVILGVAFAALTVRDKHGLSMSQRIIARRLFNRSSKSCRNIYRSGPVGHVPTGKCRLPGLLATSELHEFQDSFMRPFALLHMPATNHVSVVIEVEPTGLALDDRENIDSYVANWGAWLSGLSKTSDIVAASVTVETAPDYGVRLRHEIDSNMAESASAASREMMEEVKVTFPQQSAVTRAYIALTFTTWRPGVERNRKIEDIGLDLGSRLGKFTEHLEVCGAGDAHPVTAQTLCEVVMSAYDPMLAEHFDAAHSQGVTPPVRWDNAGPVAHEAGWEWYRHASGFSKSWVMSVAPRGVIFSNVFEDLLTPSPDVNRKRVTFLYRPVAAGSAMDVAEADVNAAKVRASATKRPSYRAAAELASAEQTAREVAKDASLINFGMVITATVMRSSDARAAAYEIEDLAGTAQLIIRPAYGSQDVAFAASLPLGLVLPDYVAVPARVREAI